MKKSFLSKIFLFLITTSVLIISCNRQGELENYEVPNKSVNKAGYSSKDANLTKEELIDELVHDEEFISLGNNFVNFITNMPNRQNFLQNYSEEDL